jgi:hypothetical protein
VRSDIRTCWLQGKVRQYAIIGRARGKRGLSGTSRVLPCHPTRCLALLQKAGLINDKDRVFIGQMLNNIIAHSVAQCIGIPWSIPRADKV